MTYPASDASESYDEDDTSEQSESESTSDAPSQLKKGNKMNPLRRWAQQGQ